MGERATIPGGRGGAGIFEAALLYSTFWLRALLPLGGHGIGPADAIFHLSILLNLVPAGGLILWVMHRGEGFPAFSLDTKARPGDAAGALGVLAVLLLVGLLPGSVAGLLYHGQLPSWLDNPLLAPSSGPRLPTPVFIPLVLAASLVTGHVEELYFRVYLSYRLKGAGLGKAARILLSSLIFGLSHANQGLPAAFLALILGAVLALRWEAKKSWHEIGLGHGLYDFIVFLILLYA
ncbi:MAG TPA: CPBP family intramembrane glutamic endopeptidase [Rectinemataceae bacterium]|nr:CPBP family intramembrane glutamic endopeptidase [Rectinemataceae bacterium]